MAHPNINERRFYIARMLDAGETLNGNIKRQTAELFNCHVSAIQADCKYFDSHGWHEELETAPPAWWQEGKIAGSDVTTIFSSKELQAKRVLLTKQIAVSRMGRTARATVKSSNGQEVLRSVKNKELLFTQEKEFNNYIESLINKQSGLCAITGIRLQYDGDCEDTELLCSLDRINSDGHYERNNLQVVCRFINRWKGDSDNGGFHRLIEYVRLHREGG